MSADSSASKLESQQIVAELESQQIVAELESQQIVAELEEAFKYRFTDEDEEYKTTLSQSIPPPPAVIPWSVRPKRNYDWSSNRSGDRWGWQRRESHHDDYRDRDRHHSRHSHHSGGGDGYGYQNRYYKDDRYGGRSGRHQNQGGHSSVFYPGQQRGSRHSTYRRN